MKKKFTIPLVILLLTGTFSCREKSSAPVRRVLSGHIAAVGNEPFVKLVLRDREGNIYEIAPDDRERLKRHQGEFITIEADVHTLKMKTADGKYTRKIWLIKSITIIKQ